MKEIYGRMKVAASAWSRAMDAGRLGLDEIRRLGGGAPAAIRARLQTPGQELTGAALDRYQHLSAQQATAKVLATGGQLRNHPGVGPGVVGGQIGVSPQSGTAIRQVASGSTPQRILGMATTASGRDLHPMLYKRLAEPGDRSLYASVVAHELAERQALHGVAEKRYEGNPVASHLGVAPLLAERIGQRDHNALSTFDRLRATSGKDDPILRKKLREMGMVANYTQPLGGRAHRSAEHFVAQMPAEDASMNRFMMQKRINVTPETQAKFDSASRLYGKVKRFVPPAVQENIAAMGKAFDEATHRPLSFDRTNPEHAHNLSAWFTSV